MDSNSVLDNIYDPLNHNSITLYNNEVNLFYKPILRQYIKNYNSTKVSNDMLVELITLLEKNENVCEIYLQMIKSFEIAKLVDFVKALSDNKFLEVLDFTDNSGINDAIRELLVLLKNDINLRFLYLTKTKLGFCDIKLLSDALMFNTNLVHLNISKNNIGDKGIECILDGLKENDTLMWLDISNNSITNNSIVKITEAFKYNTSITTFDMSINIIGIEGLDVLVELFKHNKTLVNLHLDWCWLHVPYYYIEDDNKCKFTNSQSYKLIDDYTLRNRRFYDKTYWKPYLTHSFPPELKQQFLTFMLCNSENKNVVLPFNICIDIFKFMQRKDYFN